MSTRIVNGKRLRVGDRLTKAGVAAETHFDQLVVEHLKSVGAVVSPNAYGWQLETAVGGLRVGTRGHYIVQCFDDWNRAKLAGFRHWKWNFHFDLGAAENEVAHWARQLAAVLPSASPLVVPDVAAVTKADIEQLRADAAKRGDLNTVFIANVALEEEKAAMHPVDARDECVGLIIKARRRS